MSKFLLKVRNKGLSAEVIYMDFRALDTFTEKLKDKFVNVINGQNKEKVISISREEIGEIYDCAETLEDYYNSEPEEDNVIFEREKAFANKENNQVLDVIFEAA